MRSAQLGALSIALAGCGAASGPPIFTVDASVVDAPLESRPEAASPFIRAVDACPRKGGRMVFVRGGAFRMGSSDAPGEPVRDVVVRGFCMDITEVTVAAYSECVRAGACVEAASTMSAPTVAEDDRRFLSPACNGDRTDRQDHPVNCVDWFAAEAFCAWAGKSLPTDEQWEFAARGGAEERKHPWGNAAPSATLLNGCDDRCVAWAASGAHSWPTLVAGDDGFELTAPVGSFPAGDSVDGIHDLAGNVWEWTQTIDGPNADSPRIDRGGGWAYTGGQDGYVSALRGHDLPTLRNVDLGFRCAD
jgi:formylglycine-generating enzyme required for sulfatase activity